MRLNTILRTTLTTLFLLFSGLTHAVSAEKVVSCMNDPELDRVLQATVYKDQGLSKRELINRLRSDIPTETKEKILNSINYVYDLTFEYSPSVTYFTTCLNKQ